MNWLLFANDFWHILGSRSYVSGLLIDTRVVALLGLRTRSFMSQNAPVHARQFICEGDGCLFSMYAF
ncbi:hypothetical protein [Neptunicoccus cionae]|uniref:hypothetical protein n=1 Tax=Neptunicoccus cionae TaxID=2035344 RepID=UPI0016640DAC|nr:hypothetical protein [Amylibacter cionae]